MTGRWVLVHWTWNEKGYGPDEKLAKGMSNEAQQRPCEKLGSFPVAEAKSDQAKEAAAELVVQCPCDRLSGSIGLTLRGGLGCHTEDLVSGDGVQEVRW